MNDQGIIETIIGKLNNYPNVKFNRKNEFELVIYRRDESGYDILIQVAHKENTLNFGTFHWHYDNNDEESTELINNILLGLTGIARIKEYSKNNEAYKCTLQLQDREGNWRNHGTTGFPSLCFWIKTKIKYFQNDLLPKELVYNNIDK